MYNFIPAIPARSDLDWCWYLRRQGKSGEALERALHDIGVMDPGGWANWGPSTLTATGAPVQMVFFAGQTDLRLTTEVANPATQPATRISDVCNIMNGRGAKQPSAALRDVISAAQSAGPLSYGARLGLRHGPAGLQCQLFAELPAAATDLSSLMCPKEFGPIMNKLGSNISATMLGYDGTTGSVTVHFKMQNPKRRCLPILAAPAQVSPDVLSMAIDQLTDRIETTEMPVSTLEFSYQIQPDGTPPVLTLYLSSAQAIGSDADVARRIKTSGGYGLTGYRALFDDLPPAPVPHNYHGNIGMRARQAAAPLLSIEVAAPWGQPDDS